VGVFYEWVFFSETRCINRTTGTQTITHNKRPQSEISAQTAHDVR